MDEDTPAEVVINSCRTEAFYEKNIFYSLVLGFLFVQSARILAKRYQI